MDTDYFQGGFQMEAWAPFGEGRGDIFSFYLFPDRNLIMSLYNQRG